MRKSCLNCTVPIMLVLTTKKVLMCTLNNLVFSDNYYLYSMVPRKVYTPGSQPPDKHGKAKAKAKGGLGLSPGHGRPSKKKGSTKGFSRKGNYRHRYTPEMIRQALQLVADKTMTLNAAAKKYGIPKTTLFDRMKFRTTAARSRQDSWASSAQKIRPLEKKLGRKPATPQII